MTLLDRETVLALLSELGTRAHQEGVQIDLYLVGGAAVAISLDSRRVTRDVDVVFRSGSRLDDIVASMADEHALPQDWPNSAATAYVPPEPDDDAILLDMPGLSVSVASARHLLAMKMAAARPGQDMDDLAVLFRVVGISEPAEAVRIAQQLYGEESLVLSDPPESYVYLAEDVLARIRREDEATS